VAFLVYLNTRSMPKTLIVLLAVPFSAVGAVWLLWALGYNISIGVWVGLIALLGLDAETGIFMLLYLDLAYDQMKPKTRDELREAIYHGAVKRVRPKIMTVACAFFGCGKRSCSPRSFFTPRMPGCLWRSNVFWSISS